MCSSLEENYFHVYVEGGKVDIWDVRNGENVCTVRCSTAKSKPVTCLKVNALLESIGVVMQF